MTAATTSDRLWILARASDDAGASGLARKAGGGSRPTLVVRDRDSILIRFDVTLGAQGAAMRPGAPKLEHGSAIERPLARDEAQGAGSTLIVRIASETTPCARCVDESVSSAVERRGRLDAAGVFEAVHDGIVRCAERARLAPDHGDEGAGEVPPESGRRRSLGSLRLAPEGAPHVPAGDGRGTDRDVDVVLIIG